MTNFTISRTRALKFFRAKLGHPVRNLNSVVVGLAGVGAGVVLKPNDLAISWNPSDLKKAELEARGFAIRSLMVTACDALDHYMQDLVSGASPVDAPGVKSVLKKELQTVSQAQPLSAVGIAALEKQLNDVRGNPLDIKKALGEFSERYCGKQKSPSLKARCDALLEYAAQSRGPNISDYPLRPSYHAAVVLLVTWRNVLVHDMDSDPLAPTVAQVLEDDREYLSENHARIDISQTLERYQKKAEPTLKDISTLVSVLMRHVATLDARILDGCDMRRFVREAMAQEIESRGKEHEFLRKLAGKGLSIRISKAFKIINGHGFVSRNSGQKKDGYPGRLIQDEDVDFLDAPNFEELQQAVFP